MKFWFFTIFILSEYQYSFTSDRTSCSPSPLHIKLRNEIVGQLYYQTLILGTMGISFPKTNGILCGIRLTCIQKINSIFCSYFLRESFLLDSFHFYILIYVLQAYENKLPFNCVFINQNRLREEVFLEMTHCQFLFISWNFKFKVTQLFNSK